TVLPLGSNLESETLIRSSGEPEANVRNTREIAEGDRTRLFNQGAQSTASARPTTNALATATATGLTRVGAILGTPLYMSPEQCRGELLDARSDIYSLGIIAYQMLTGSPPFTGDTATIITAHKESQPAHIRQLNKKLPKRVSRVIMSALEKNPAV